MPKRFRDLLQHSLWLGLCVLLLPCAQAQGDPPGRIGRLARVEGAAWRFDDQTSAWEAAGVNRPLTTGDRLSLEGNGGAVVQIGSTTVRVNGNSEIEFRQIDDRHIVLTLVSGSLALRVVAPEVVPEIEVHTAEASFVPRRTGHYRLDRRDGTTSASTWTGELSALAPGMKATVTRGQRLDLWLDNGSATPVQEWQDAENDAFSAWVTQDADTAPRSLSERYVSPEMTGWDDLDRHGQWQTHAEYGAVWFPTVVTGWAPYRYGHWVWVNPWGWTWVDDAPWGFAPFHYGRWVMVGGRWCWSPGQRVVRPVYAPALVGWVGAGGVSVGVSVYPSRSSPPHAWVPLSPHEAYRPHYQASPVYQRPGNGTHGQVIERSDRRRDRDDRYRHQRTPDAVTEFERGGGLLNAAPLLRPWPDERQERSARQGDRHPERMAVPMAAPRESRDRSLPLPIVVPPLPGRLEKQLPMPPGVRLHERSRHHEDRDDRDERNRGR